MMSEVNVLWSSAWLKLQKNLARSDRTGAPTVAGSIRHARRPDPVLSAASWLVRARKGILQESSLSR
jgi:hypothetical protein